MLDTALIDEEEVPVLNRVRSFLKEGGRIIPQSIINVAEPVFMKNHYIQYEDLDSHPEYEVLGKFVVYSDIDFLEKIDESFQKDINLSLFDGEFFNSEEYEAKDLIDEDKYIKVNGIKITSFTRLGENIICGPTPMLNPSLLVPIEEIKLKAGESFEISEE